MGKIKYFKSTDVAENNKIDFKQILKGVIGAAAFIIIFLLIAAALLTYTDIHISFVSVISSVAFYIGALFGGVISSLKLKSYGWLHGMFAGGIYSLIIFCISIISNAGSNDLKFPLLKIILSVVIGGIGGIIGLNIRISKNNRR